MNVSNAATNYNVVVSGTYLPTVTSSNVSCVVNALPVPALTGVSSVCVNSSGNVYTTESGMTNYIWTVNGRGSITSGGTTGSNTTTVTWNLAGIHPVTVVYTNANNCTSATSTILNINVNTLPVPTITGQVSACVNSTGNVYTTEASMTGYTWTVSTGGLITAGGTTNAITVSWNTTGAKTVTVNYSNANACTATTASLYNVTVNQLPVPTITGVNSVCQGATGVVYTSQAGMTNYIWTISPGGIITAGTGTNNISVTWNTAGNNAVSVNYTNGTSCSALAPVAFPVTVNILTVPTITGPSSVCLNAAGTVYTTEAGMTGYTWAISAGAIITAGAASNAVTITWNTAGAKTVSVNYLNANNCNAATSTSYNVTVNSLPVPAITGPVLVCQGASGVVYTTQAGMTNYIWTVPSGAIITSGGTPNSNTITLTWNNSGLMAVTVNYTNINGCVSLTPASFSVTVNPQAVPTIGSTNTPCLGSVNNIYYTEIGQSNYFWTVSSGIIVSGQATSTINVTWTGGGQQNVTVNYTNSLGCPAAEAYVYNLFVNPLPSIAGAIAGVGTVCAGTNSVAYSTTSVLNATSYTWTLPAGATIATGAGTTSITVNYGPSAVSGNISVTGNNSCGDGIASDFAITVNPLPAAAGTIIGSAAVCEGAGGVNYMVSSVTGAASYAWTVPSGAIITSGATTNQVAVSFGSVAASGVITVKGINACGSGVLSHDFMVVVNPIPSAPVISSLGSVLTSSALSGNQWYYEGTAIAGATGQSYTITNNTGYYWCVVSLNGCSSANSNKVWVVVTNTMELPVSASFTIYPVPNNGQFTASIRFPVDNTFNISVYNQIGSKLLELKNVNVVGGKSDTQINLRPLSNGVYIVVFMNNDYQVVKRVLVNN